MKNTPDLKRRPHLSKAHGKADSIRKSIKENRIDAKKLKFISPSYQSVNKFVAILQQLDLNRVIRGQLGAIDVALAMVTRDNATGRRWQLLDAFD